MVVGYGLTKSLVFISDYHHGTIFTRSDHQVSEGRSARYVSSKDVGEERELQEGLSQSEGGEWCAYVQGEKKPVLASSNS